jgi:hypothetical protein
MPRTLADAAEKGWAVVGAAAESGAIPVSEFKVDRPTVLVMGEWQDGNRNLSLCPKAFLCLCMSGPEHAVQGGQIWADPQQ